MGHRAVDYYPTPACAARALVSDIAKTCPDGLDAIIDPAAGRGALPHWMSDLGASWYLMEMCEDFRPDLQRVGEKVIICDSLSRVWDPLTHVIANPPYGKHLEPFVRRIHQHVRSYRTFGAVLMRLQWFDDGDDRHVRLRPDRILRLPWRVSYTGKGSPSETHCWAIWLPTPNRITETVWAERPILSDADRDFHATMAGMHRNQLPLPL